jgi:hypothetical protein
LLGVESHQENDQGQSSMHQQSSVHIREAAQDHDGAMDVQMKMNHEMSHPGLSFPDPFDQESRLEALKQQRNELM